MLRTYRIFVVILPVFFSVSFCTHADACIAVNFQKISNTEGNFTGILDNDDHLGRSVTHLGDLDGDGVDDIVVGAYNDDDGGTNAGAVYVLFMNQDHTVKSHQKISNTQGGFTGSLDDSDEFGVSVASIGDLDNDGVTDIAVGAFLDDDGVANAGAVWILFLNSDGTVKSHQKISNTQGGFGGSLDNDDVFGCSLACIGDLNKDGVTDIVVGSRYDGDGGSRRGAIWVLFLNSNGTVKTHQKISGTQGGFTGILDNNDQFGGAVASTGDLDGDGVIDLAVGAGGDDDGGTDRGAVWILFLNLNGTVKSHQKISDTNGGFTGVLDNYDSFAGCAYISDLDGDGIADLAVGAGGDDDGGTDRGAVWLLYLNPDGTVKSHDKISDTEGGFLGTLDDGDGFGSVAYLGGPGSKGTINFAVGAAGDDDGGNGRGAVWILFERFLYVDDDAPDDPVPHIPDANVGGPDSDPLEDGSGAHPFDGIQKAIQKVGCEAYNQATIVVRDGWYTGVGNYNIDPCGLNIKIKSEHGPWYSIIYCEGKGRGFVIENGENSCTVIDGLLILDGYTNYIGGGIFCDGTSPTIQNCVLALNYAECSGGGIFLWDSNSVIRRCEVIINDAEVAAGGIYCHNSNPTIQNCVVAYNWSDYSGAISSNTDSNTTIVNCTIADNFADRGAGAIECYDNGSATVLNSILWNNTCCDFNEQIFLELNGTISIDFSDVEDGCGSVYVEDANSTLFWGYGNIDEEPLFSDYFFIDYHLKSAVGRWTPIIESNGDYNNDGIINFIDFAIFAKFWQQNYPPGYIDLTGDYKIDFYDLELFGSRWLGPGENLQGWETDDVNSPCIDAGDPTSVYLLEPTPNGSRINMGAYGNTEQASKSGNTGTQLTYPDLDRDKDVDFIDYAMFANAWRNEGVNLPEDFNYDEVVNEKDLLEFSNWWLWGKVN